MGKIRTKLGAFGKSAGKALGGANKAVDSITGRFQKLGDSIGIGAAVSVAGLGYAIQDVMGLGAQFERTLVTAGTAYETPVKRGTAAFKELTEAARAAGRTTEFSATASTQALLSFATAGFTARQSIAALPAVMNFATAAGLELSQATDIASDTLGQFNLRSTDAAKNAANMGRIMDVMARAAADSTTNVAELFDGMKVGAAVASSAGASVEEFTALLGVLANAGVKGSEAGTAIRNSFAALNAPSTAAKKTLEGLGVQIARSSDGSLDMTATIGRLTKATGKLTKSQKAQALTTIFGRDTVGPFLTLMNAGEEAIAKFTAGLEGAGGTTKAMAESIRSDTLGQMQRFSNIIEDLKLGVFAAISEDVLKVADGVGKWVSANQDLIKTKLGEFLTLVKDALPKIVEWLPTVAKGMAAFVALAVGVKILNTAVLAYESAAKLATGVTWAWGVALKASKAAVKATWIQTVGLKIALLASRAATVATTAATWLYNAALKAGQLGMTRFTVAQVAGKVAQLASQAATVLATAAQTAYAAVVSTTSLAMNRFTVAEVASKLAQLASRAATLLATAAQTAYAAVVAVTSGALGAFSAATLASVTAIGAQAAALAPLLITIGAATAAVMALVAAWNQYNALDKQLEGSGGISGTVSKMIEMGTFDPFKAHDAVLNEKARQKQTEPQVISPQARAAAETAEANAQASVDGQITVEAAPGTKATVRAKPRSVPLTLQPSGAF